MWSEGGYVVGRGSVTTSESSSTLPHLQELEEARLEEDKLGPFRIMPDDSSTRTNGNGSGHGTS